MLDVTISSYQKQFAKNRSHKLTGCIYIKGQENINIEFTYATYWGCLNRMLYLSLAIVKIEELMSSTTWLENR